MAILYDARGNEILGSFPDRLNGQVQTDGRTATNLLAAANAEVLIDCDGLQTIAYDVRTAAAVLTFLFEGTIDGTNYFQLPAFALNSLVGATIASEQYVGSVTLATTHSAIYLVECAGFKRIRIRVSAYTSGNITVAVRGTVGESVVYIKPIPTILWVTATAAANTAATATLPAAGAGLFHYITHIQIVRNATAALAGTATLIHTSTNLPGNPAWSVGNAMAAGGTQIDLDLQLAQPLKSLLANTNTTIVAAAGGAAVLNRVNVGYYVGA
jgi:hypothetical protein